LDRGVGDALRGTNIEKLGSNSDARYKSKKLFKGTNVVDEYKAKMGELDVL
jgi:hypothetical protein